MSAKNKPVGEGWREMPNVRTAGSFYARRCPLSGRRQWYMRTGGTWRYSEEQELPQGQTWGYAPVVEIPTPRR